MACPPISNGLRLKPRPLPSVMWSRLVLCLALTVALPAQGQVNPLPPEKAFRFSARALNPETIETRFTIADGYYLYRDRIHFTVEPATTALTIPPLPQGKVKDDQFFGRVETYRDSLMVNLRLKDT